MMEFPVTAGLMEALALVSGSTVVGCNFTSGDWSALDHEESMALCRLLRKLVGAKPDDNASISLIDREIAIRLSPGVRGGALAVLALADTVEDALDQGVPAHRIDAAEEGKHVERGAFEGEAAALEGGAAHVERAASVDQLAVDDLGVNDVLVVEDEPPIANVLDLSSSHTAKLHDLGAPPTSSASVAIAAGGPGQDPAQGPLSDDDKEP